MVMGVKRQMKKTQADPASLHNDIINKDNSDITTVSSSSSKSIDCSNNLNSSPLPIKLNSENLLDAIIYSEILGKPKCKRRGRVR